MPGLETELDLGRAGVGTVVWATGFQPDYDWIEIGEALAGDGAPVQVRGVSPVEGLFFVGIHRMHEAAAGTVLGCGWVAEYVTDRIAARLSTAGPRQAVSPRSARNSA
jgi:putative flavoprotein involved in K+ transport